MIRKVTKMWILIKTSHLMAGLSFISFGYLLLNRFPKTFCHVPSFDLDWQTCFQATFLVQLFTGFGFLSNSLKTERKLMMNRGIAVVASQVASQYLDGLVIAAQPRKRRGVF